MSFLTRLPGPKNRLLQSFFQYDLGGDQAFINWLVPVLLGQHGERIPDTHNSMAGPVSICPIQCVS